MYMGRSHNYQHAPVERSSLSNPSSSSDILDNPAPTQIPSPAPAPTPTPIPASSSAPGILVATTSCHTDTTAEKPTTKRHRPIRSPSCIVSYDHWLVPLSPASAFHLYAILIARLSTSGTPAHLARSRPSHDLRGKKANHYSHLMHRPDEARTRGQLGR